MRISVTYLYAIFRYGYPPKPADELRALEDLSKMGFHYLEMESLGPEHGLAVWEGRSTLKRCLDDNGIRIHNFCGVDADLVSLDKSKRAAAYERFERTAELGVYLGADTLHLASYAPPIQYLGKSPYALGQNYAFGNVFRVRIPDDFSWNGVWAILIESCQATARIAAKHGRTIIMEPRVGEIICSVDSMIRLVNDVGMDNFKANFDTGHFSAQRENVPLALAKLRGKFANIHLSDNDPATAEHLPLGDGTIDWPEFFRLLELHEYNGYLGLDLGGRESLVDDLRRSADFVDEMCAANGIAIER